jgi:ATP-dependent helicase/nuclease subunit A
MTRDAPARERIRNDLDATLIVEAGAGTGKTTALVGRVLSLIASGKTLLSRVALVTFTERAAGEMKLRLRAEIDRARNAPTSSDTVRARLDRALSELEEARIGTIHGFCADLLRERAIEAGVDPLFEVASEAEQDGIYREAFEQWFLAELVDPPEGVRRVLSRRPRDRRSEGPKEELCRAGRELIAERDFDAPWRRPAIDRPALLDGALSRLAELGALCAEASQRDDYLVRHLLDIQRFVDEARQREAVRDGSRDYDALEAELHGLLRLRSWNWRGSMRGFPSAAMRKNVLALRSEVRAELERIVEQLDADLAACLFTELSPLTVLYERKKARLGKLDFVDLLLVTKNLIKDDRDVRIDLQTRFSHLLVDEFQDTDPLQADILLLLSADDPDGTDVHAIRPIPGKLFLVGDPKQSIYRFRRADVALYEAVKRRLVGRGASVVHLVTSFRSVPSLQAAVNGAFASRMRGSDDGSQAEYVALEPHRQEATGRPTIVALPVPKPYGDYGKVVHWKIDESVPHAVGAFVDWLIHESGWTIPSRTGGEPSKVEARDICLLFKRFQKSGDDVTRPYVRALEVRQIPHVLVGGKSLHAREEVTAIRSALRAIEWPDDELSVYATLRGPLLAITDDALLAWRAKYERLDPTNVPEEELTQLLSPVAEALALMGRLHGARSGRRVADTLSDLLEATRAHAGIAIWPTGQQALGNVLRILDLARRFEARGATSFRSFLLWLDEQAERGGAAEAPIVEEGTDGVRMMTVHKAKGLEFPVVVLVDPTAPATFEKPTRYVDAERRLWAMPLCGCAPLDLLEQKALCERHDQEEAVRLAYVAATRARELLVVPVVGDEATGSESARGWYDVLHPVIYPKRPERRTSTPAPGCPAFGDDSVLERPDNAEASASSSVRPGLVRPEVGTHGVVFWDPKALDLSRTGDVGLRQQRILAADEGNVAADEGERLHAAWVSARAALLLSGALPSVVVRTVTAEAERVATAGDVEICATDGVSASRPHGKRFGALVHAVLAVVPLDADDQTVRACAAAHGRMLGATDEEVAAAIDAAVAALGSPVFERARAAGASCQREAPIVYRKDDGTVLEGVVDLLFREDDAWCVVDFKTDADLGEREASYKAQVTLYAEAVSRATGETARALLLRV